MKREASNQEGNESSKEKKIIFQMAYLVCKREERERKPSRIKLNYGELGIVPT